MSSSFKRDQDNHLFLAPGRNSRQDWGSNGPRFSISIKKPQTKKTKQNKAAAIEPEEEKKILENIARVFKNS